MVEAGPDKLKITPLCNLKGVTKGSFYHHFKNRNEFIEALMGFWYEQMTVAFIEHAQQQSTPLEKLKALDSVIAQNNIEAEMHIRAWALKEQSVAQYLGKIDSQRIAYLADCYKALGKDEHLANNIAMLSYANFLGMQQIHPKPSIEQSLDVAALAAKALLPELND